MRSNENDLGYYKLYILYFRQQSTTFSSETSKGYRRGCTVGAMIARLSRDSALARFGLVIQFERLPRYVVASYNIADILHLC